jgi:hypothetical protein
MKKIAIISASATIALLPLVAFAASFASGNIGDVLTNIQNTLLSLLGVVIVIALLIAAFYFVTAQGDETKLGTARKFVLWALVGGAVGLMAIVLLNLVATIVGGGAAF